MQAATINRNPNPASLDYLTDTLTEQVGAIQSSDDFQRYLALQARFHTYSYRNILLILAQRPDAQRIAGYEAWKKLGRVVHKGERAIKIYAPIFARGDEEGDHGRPVAFRSVSVFDLAQTEGDDLPDFPIDPLTEETGGALYTTLAAVSATHRLTLTNEADMEAECNGYYNARTKTIYVKPQAQLHMTKTLAHELAHALDTARQQRAPAESETIAKSVAYIVLAHYGHNSGSYSFPYIAEWTRAEDGAKLLTRLMQVIQPIARQLIAAIADLGITIAPTAATSQPPATGEILAASEPLSLPTKRSRRTKATAA